MCDYGSFLAPANDILLSFLEEDGGWVDGNGCCDQHSDLYIASRASLDSDSDLAKVSQSAALKVVVVVVLWSGRSVDFMEEKESS